MSVRQDGWPMLEVVGYLNNIIHIAGVGAISTTASTTNDPLRALLGPTCYASLIALDLERAPYVDSSGLGWLISCQKRFQQGGGRMVIHSVPRTVLQVFQLVRLESALNICPDREAAIALLSASSTTTPEQPK